MQDCLHASAVNFSSSYAVPDTTLIAIPSVVPHIHHEQLAHLLFDMLLLPSKRVQDDIIFTKYEFADPFARPQ